MISKFMFSKLMPILTVLFVISFVTNYRQASLIDEYKKGNVSLMLERDEAVAMNRYLTVQIEQIKQERDANQQLVDKANEKNHQLQQQALTIQTKIRTVIQYEKCTHTAIPSAAIERMRKQYQDGDAVQNGGTQTAPKLN